MEEYKERALFLKPSFETIELEKKLDRFGYFVQIYFYHILLEDKPLSLRLWGLMEEVNVPRWQRMLLPIYFPIAKRMVKRGLKITEENVKKARVVFDETFREISERLERNGNKGILGSERSYIDFTWAALSAPFIVPKNYGGRFMEKSSKVTRDEYPEELLEYCNEMASTTAGKFTFELYQDRIDNKKERIK